MANWWDPDDAYLKQLIESTNKALEKKDMTHTVTLIALDGLTKTIQISGTPEIIQTPLFSEGKDYGTRTYKRDKFRDGEYRETEAKKSVKVSTYKDAISEMADKFVRQGHEEAITIHVHPRVFNAIHREFSSKDPEKDLTYMEINTSSMKVFVRYAPEKSKTLQLAGDLKTLTLKELVDLKLAQDKK